MAVGVALFMLAACSSSGSGAQAADTTTIKDAPSTSIETTTTVAVAATSTTTTLSSKSHYIGDVQAVIKAAGIPCGGAPHRFVAAENHWTLGEAPLFELTCRVGNGVQIKVWEWSSPSARWVSVMLANSITCRAGLVNLTYLESGPWTVSAYRDLETDNALTERMAQALRVKPTVVKCLAR